MKICQLCGIEFSTYHIHNGKPRNLHERRFCVKCHPIGTPAPLPKKIPNCIENNTLRKCNKCQKILPNTIEHFYKTPKYNSLRPTCKKCCLKVPHNLYRKKLKLQAVEYKGGKCEICGYDKCLAALDFHHKNPEEKDFNIGRKNVASFDKIKAEVDKCILLCSNCHRELHWKTESS